MVKEDLKQLVQREIDIKAWAICYRFGSLDWPDNLGPEGASPRDSRFFEGGRLTALRQIYQEMFGEHYNGEPNNGMKWLEEIRVAQEADAPS